MMGYETFLVFMAHEYILALDVPTRAPALNRLAQYIQHRTPMHASCSADEHSYAIGMKSQAVSFLYEYEYHAFILPDTAKRGLEYRKLNADGLASLVASRCTSPPCSNPLYLLEAYMMTCATCDD